MPAPIAAIILAAGQGSRLGGRAKPALRIDGVSLLERLARGLRDAGVAPVRAVIGPYADILMPLAQRAAIAPLAQALPDASLADSQRLALREHVRAHPDHDLLLVLADLPLLDANAIADLLAQWRACAPGADSLRPRVDGAPGHPLLLS
ncbi:NTP transferase domain-containing protein, partial [Achromobacter insuavis]|uniref:NTP transferase domain-containing protein n=2 Tax=Achromobacter TaxID=222 RepID=UPI0015D3DC74